MGEQYISIVSALTNCTYKKLGFGGKLTTIWPFCTFCPGGNVTIPLVYFNALEFS